MRVISETNRLESPVCLVLGNFDGVHLGHQAVLGQAKAYALSNNLKTAVLSFDPHPLKLLAPERAPKLLQTPKQKIRLLEECGLDFYLPVPFDETMARRSPEEFVQFLLEKANVKHVMVGFNFRFGHQREGDVVCLSELTRKHEITLHVTQGVTVNHDIVSSSRIRNMVQEGHMLEAAELLGRPYFLEGQVSVGRGLGRQLEVPTANISVENECLPRFGVYASWVNIGDGQWYRSITNVGIAPTVPHLLVRVESHLLGIQKNLYHQKLRVCFGAFIRPERRFASLEQLEGQIREDICVRAKLPDMDPPQFNVPIS